MGFWKKEKKLKVSTPIIVYDIYILLKIKFYPIREKGLSRNEAFSFSSNFPNKALLKASAKKFNRISCSKEYTGSKNCRVRTL